MSRLRKNGARNTLGNDSLSLVSLLIALGWVMVLVPSAHASLCPIDEPIEEDLANNNTYYIQLCNLDPPGDPCPAPAPPTIDSVDAQAADLSAVVPDFMDSAHAVWWKAWVYSEDDGFWHAIWVHESTEDVPTGGLLPGDVVTFGAPGLQEGQLARFQVAFESEFNFVTCWSAWTTTADPLPGFDAAVGPSPPGDMGWRVEDVFERPDTETRCFGPSSQKGDGLGPEAVWQGAAVQANPCPRIDGGAAYFGPSSDARYAGHEAEHWNSFADALVQVDEPGTDREYNFQVQTRVSEPFPDPCNNDETVIKSYAAKLILGPRHCAEPTLFLVRGPEEYPKATCQPDGSGGSVPVDPDYAIECTGLEEPPLREGGSAWLRIEARDVQGTRNVALKGTVAWDCVDANGDGEIAMTECETCSFTRTDEYESANGDCQPLFGQSGKWSMGFHERWYFIDVFRAGDAAAGTP